MRLCLCGPRSRVGGCGGWVGAGGGSQGCLSQETPQHCVFNHPWLLLENVWKCLCPLRWFYQFFLKCTFLSQKLMTVSFGF